MRVLFVCLGNICRSPTAEAVFRHRVMQANVSDCIEIDSAGTGDWHVGHPPDQRAQRAAAQRGYDLSALRARQVCATDFERFDYVLAMDRSNLHDLKQLHTGSTGAMVALFLSFAANATHHDVPDPYYGGVDGFENVLNLIEDASDGLLEHIYNNFSEKDY
ncbi:MAG: low molecular weight phosphotyrosine protein phosphatase [Gammaproteobacteria bacterium]